MLCLDTLNHQEVNMAVIVYIDMDDTLCDFRSAFEQTVADNPTIAFPQSQYGFFENIASIEGDRVH